MKKTILIFACLLSISSFLKAQEAPYALKDCLGDPEIPKRSICLTTDYQKEVIDNIKWTLDKGYVKSSHN